MSKRFIDTGLLEKPWFMELTPAEKLAWVYITMKCDNVGVWTPNYRLAEFVIGEAIGWTELAEKCNGNIRILDDGKWWLVDYCTFQHPDLMANPDGGNSNALKAYVRDLKAHGIYDDFYDQAMGIRRASGGHGDAPKDKVKERVREKEKEEERIEIYNGVWIGSSTYHRLVSEFGDAAVRWAGEQRRLWELEKGKALAKDYGRAVGNWLKKARELGELPETTTGPTAADRVAARRREVFGE